MLYYDRCVYASFVLRPLFTGLSDSCGWTFLEFIILPKSKHAHNKKYAIP